jgi:hypothetical protein
MSIEGNRSEGGMFRPGEILYASKLNELAQHAGYGRQWHSSNTLVAQGPFGTVDLTGSPDAGMPVDYDYPFKVTLGIIDLGTTVYVRPGSVNNFMPKISGNYLDATPKPYLHFVNFTSSKTKIVALKVTKDGVKFFPQTCEIVLLDNYGELVNTDNIGYLAIASITGDNSANGPIITGVYQLVYASQIVIRAKPGTETAIWSFSSR